MVPLFAGLAVLLAVMLLARWFVTATPQTVLRTFKWTGAALLVGSGALLLVSGRVGWGLAAVAGLTPLVVRAVHLHRLYRAGRAGWRRVRPGREAPGASRVETRFLRMSLEHTSGALRGEVTEGPFRGRQLSDLSFEEAMELARQCAGDAQSIQVLEVWLDRTWPDWRERAAARPPPPSSTGPMSRDEALAVLGLGPKPTPAEVRSAHRRLMAMVHPDLGGSNYLAAKINLAKDTLLSD